MKNITCTIFLLISALSLSQTPKNVEANQFSINLLLPGVVFEHGISENTTLAAEATVGFALRGCSGCETDFGIYPIGRFQYRYYYNFDRRLQKGKRISGNTGNYIAPIFAVQGGKAVIGDLDFTSDFFAGLGAVYGIQRTAPKGFQFRLEGGPGYVFDEFDDGFGFFIAVKLGWVIGHSKNN